MPPVARRPRRGPGRPRVPQARAVIRRRRIRNNQLRLPPPRPQRPIALTGATPVQLDLGQMDQSCEACGALHFHSERSASGLHMLCCQGGKVRLDADTYPHHMLKPIPPLLHSLATGEHEFSANFSSHIRQFNNSLAFASLVVDPQHPLLHPGHGPRIIHVHGQAYTAISNLNVPGNAPRYGHLYMLDPSQAHRHCTENELNAGCNAQLMQLLETLLHELPNPYILMYHQMKNVCKDAAVNIPRPYTFSLGFLPHTSQSPYNQPTGSDIAIILIGEDGLPPSTMDFCIHRITPTPAEQSLQIIRYTSQDSDPLCYPLLFPNGEFGWCPELRHAGARQTAVHNRLTQRELYCYRLARREPLSLLHYSGLLFQQYICDSYIKCEANRLNFIRHNQTLLREETYQVLTDALANTQDASIGHQIVLPPSFVGGPRYMQQCYQDAMSIVRVYGKPDYFITFACNPQWPEITENLHGQQAMHAPDLVSRVFSLKLDAAMDDLTKGKILGECVAWVYTIQWKKNLPHAHILLIMGSDHKPRTTDDVDAAVQAVIPDATRHGALYAAVTRHMIHGPCGDHNQRSVCMVDKGSGFTCQKKFPKAFRDTTAFDPNNGYPLYKRPDDGHFVIRNIASVNLQLTNEWVVPYNAWLLVKFNCHINVEVCITFKKVKYLYKYVHKGHDSATIQMVGRDEVKTFFNTRYVSAPEAVWRLHAHKISESSHTVHRLPVHLPDMQTVVFKPGQLDAPNTAGEQHSELQAFFNLNASLPPNERTHLYLNIPTTHSFHKNLRVWQPRVRSTSAIARMYTVSPQEQERFALRLLLLTKVGPTSFDDLRTVEGVLQPSFAEAACLLGLLEDNTIWMQTMADTALTSMPTVLRFLFAIILAYNAPPDSQQIFDAFLAVMTKDYNHIGITGDHAKFLCMTAVADILQGNNKSLSDFGLILPVGDFATMNQMGATFNFEHVNETPNLNADQLAIYDTVFDAIERQRTDNTFFVSGCGGTGKTTLYNAIIKRLKSQQKTYIAVTFTSIAASLIEGATTVHSAFGLPLNLHEGSTSSLRHHQRQSLKIKMASIIIWDEAPMSSSLQLTVVDRYLRGLMQVNTWFGGKVVLMGGDFRQVLPVVPRASRAEVVNSSIKRHPVWNNTRIFHLRQNMRAKNDAQFSRWLEDLGDGLIPTLPDTDLINLSDFHVVTPIEDVIFPATIDSTDTQTYASFVILCPRNYECHVLNERILNRVTGASCDYLSIDTAMEDDSHTNAINFPTEFLNSLTPSGFPPHCLRLKVGAVVTLLRNLHKTDGLCDGTRLTITRLCPHSLHATTLTGKHIALPRIDFTNPPDSNTPFPFRRRQFPVRLAYVCTINKAHGQTFNKVGLLLDSPIFSHGQLYVAFSRVRRKEDIAVSIKNLSIQGEMPGHIGHYASNIVYPEALQH